MANLSVNLCGVQFKNPVIAASGTFGFGREYNELFDIGQIGGISTKGLTLEPRLGNPTPRIAESRSLGCGLGFLLAMWLFAGVRNRLEESDAPECFKGMPITLVAASIVSVAFMGFGGIIDKLFA